MKRTLAELHIALRRGLALFMFRRRSPNAPAPRPIVLGLLIGLLLLLNTAVTITWAGEIWYFDEFGLSAFMAGWGVFLLLIVIFARNVRRPPVARALADCAAIGIVALLLGLAIAVAVRLAGFETGATIGTAGYTAGLAGLALLVWQPIVYLRAGASVFPSAVRWRGLKFFAAALLPMLLVPTKPTIQAPSSPDVRVDVWAWPQYVEAYWGWEETDTSTYEPPYDYEAILYKQTALVDAALAKVAPTSGNEPQFYFVAAAPSSYHSVFKREVASARAIFDERFGQGRSVTLISANDTADETALANMTNLSLVLDGVGAKMNRDRDILVLYVTSHGSDKELSVSYSGATFKRMTSERLRASLDQSGIKNRVIILSACHSGSLIPDLEGPDTLVLTAAHADKTSFGCSNDRDWTYFGDALFNHALRETRSFPEAFEKAKVLIAEWEAKQGITPSDPQMSAGAAILEKLDGMRLSGPTRTTAKAD